MGCLSIKLKNHAVATQEHQSMGWIISTSNIIRLFFTDDERWHAQSLGDGRGVA